MTEVWRAVVVGAGPAGISAAATLARLGLRTLLLSEDDAPGGQIYRNIGDNTERGGKILAVLGDAYRDGAAIVRSLSEANVEIKTRTTAWKIDDDRVYVTSDGASEILKAEAIVLAAGAMERPVPLPGWTLPGVMTVGAAQILLKQAHVLPGGRAVLIGGGPLVWLFAKQMLAANRPPAAILLTTPAAGLSRKLAAFAKGIAARDFYRGLGWIAKVARRVPCFGDCRDISLEGTDQLEGIRFTSAGRTRVVQADGALLHEGVIPRIHPALSAGCAMEWDEAGAYLAPRIDDWGRSSRKSIFIAGDAARIRGAEAAAIHGRLVAQEIARDAGAITLAERDRRSAADQTRLREIAGFRAVLDALYPPPRLSDRLRDDTILCRCEDITTATIRVLIETGQANLNQIKSACRAGMGPCQGQQCGPSLFRYVSETTGIPPDPATYLRIRPPLFPITLSEIVAMEAAFAAADP